MQNSWAVGSFIDSTGSKPISSQMVTYAESETVVAAQSYYAMPSCRRMCASLQEVLACFCVIPLFTHPVSIWLTSDCSVFGAWRCISRLGWRKCLKTDPRISVSVEIQPLQLMK